MLEEIVLHGTGIPLLVHKKDKCKGQTCCIHNPSNHPLVHAPMNWRKGQMERICIHGVGHPDPDELAFTKGDGVHGCDGCCNGQEIMSGTGAQDNCASASDSPTEAQNDRVSTRLDRQAFTALAGAITNEFVRGTLDYGTYVKWQFTIEDLLDMGLFRKGAVVEMRITHGQD